MPIFKMCFQVYKKNIPTLMIYFVVFIMVSVIVMNVMGNTDVEGFQQQKVNVVLTADESTSLVDAIREKVIEVGNLVDLPDHENALQDALYYRKVTYSLHIPQGFTDQFMAGESVQIVTQSLPDDTGGFYIDNHVQQYLRLLRMYQTARPEADMNALVQWADGAMGYQVPVENMASEVQPNSGLMLKFAFNYYAYTIMFVVIFGIATIMLVVNQRTIKQRNACSPIKSNTVTLHLFLANLVYTMICWMILVVVCILFDLKHAWTVKTLYHMLNAFVFSLCVASISFLIGNLVKSREAVNALANVITLGTCFLSGVFIPQSMLGQSILNVASFFPTYWFVKVNERIGSVAVVGGEALQDILGYLGIQIGFCILFFALAMVISKQRRLRIEEA